MKKGIQKNLTVSLFFAILLLLSIILFYPNKQVDAIPIACSERTCDSNKQNLDAVASFTNRGTSRSMALYENSIPHKYIALPNGLCNVTLYTEGSGQIVAVSEAKDVFNDRNRQVPSPNTCTSVRGPSYCSFSMRIDDEYYMLHIETLGSNSYVVTNWNCT